MKREDNLAVIISHAWIMDKMIAWWIGVRVDDINVYTFATSNASISELIVNQRGERVLRRLNDIAHLLDIE